MTLSVSSLFQSKMEASRVTSIESVFTFNNSEITAFITGAFPVIARDFREVTGVNYVLEVDNLTQTFNDLMTDKTRFHQEGEFKWGFSDGAGSLDLVTFFKGDLTKVNYNERTAKLTFEDRFSRLAEIEVGTEESPVSFVNTDVNPADLVWWLQSSYGNMSNVKSTSNPDVDYPTWLQWWTDFDNDTVIVNAEFKGDRITDILNEIAKLTDSFIYDEGDNKLDYYRWTGTLSVTAQMSHGSTTRPVQLEMTAKEMINRMNVSYGYNPSSDSWGGTISAQDSASVNSYGLSERTLDNSLVWYTNSVHALNMAQRTVSKRGQPNLKGLIPAPLEFLHLTAPDALQFTSQVYSMNDKLFMVQGIDIDIEKKEMRFIVDEGFGRGHGYLEGFILDDDVYGLLDKDYNFLL